MTRTPSPRGLLTAALACWLLAALALLSGCSTATTARTAYMVTASADIATTVYALNHGYKETNPLGIWGALALKGSVFLIAELMPEPWRSRLYWFGSAISLSAATYNTVVLLKPKDPVCQGVQ